jgi:hypothetical protein
MSTNTATAADVYPELGRVETSLSYLVDSSERPATYMYEPSQADPPVPSIKSTRHPASIFDGRSIIGALSLDRQGFVLLHHDTAIKDFYDADAVRATYYPEVEQLVKEATGAVRVVAFDHNVRNLPMANRKVSGVREPVKFAHNDYTIKSGPQRVRDLFPSEADELLKHRFAVINVWRPISGPVQESPIAVCDARSIAQSDWVESDLKYRDRTGEVYSITFNPAHRWFYFPQMQRDEAILLKCYDSKDDGRARFTAHSAFDDPTSPPNAPARESIETRTLVFFEA